MAERTTAALARILPSRRRTREPTPVIHLHIGRNKVGSTTLQDFFLAQRTALEAAGVRYALFGHLKDSVPGVPGFGHQDELAAYAREHPDRAMLVSNEFMFGWPREFTDGMVAGLRGLDVRVIAYIRPYDAWACSSYAQDVRNGESRRDFDQYLDWLMPRLSAWPYLEAWGEGLGWDRVRVRAIDGLGLGWDDLVPDCLAAIGLDPALGVLAPASNQAPHWATLELLRSLIDRNREQAWDEAGLARAVPLRALFETCLAGHPSFSPKVQYLTPSQSVALVDLYNRDIAEIGRCTGVQLAPQSMPALLERPFLPRLDHVPAPILDAFINQATSAGFAAAHPEAAAAVLSLGLAP